jgi:hypothetical protein
MSNGRFIGTNFDGAVLRDVTFAEVRPADGGAGARRAVAAPPDLRGARLIDVRFE